jgi:hypothetical protein
MLKKSSHNLRFLYYLIIKENVFAYVGFKAIMCWEVLFFQYMFLGPSCYGMILLDPLTIFSNIANFAIKLVNPKFINKNVWKQHVLLQLLFYCKKIAWKLIKGNIDDNCHIQCWKFVESLIEIHNSIKKCMAF